MRIWNTIRSSVCVAFVVCLLAMWHSARIVIMGTEVGVGRRAAQRAGRGEREATPRSILCQIEYL